MKIEQYKKAEKLVKEIRLLESLLSHIEDIKIKEEKDLVVHDVPEFLINAVESAVEARTSELNANLELI